MSDTMGVVKTSWQVKSSPKILPWGPETGFFINFGPDLTCPVKVREILVLENMSIKAYL